MTRLTLLKSATIFMMITSSVAMAYLFLRPGGLRQAELPRYYAVGDFSLTDQAGHKFGSEQLKGKIYVVSFIFSHCRNSCPMIVAQLKRLAALIADKPSDLRLVSITVDPKRDTPQRLRQYAKDLDADTTRWIFLTGTRQQLKDVIVGQYKIAAEPGESGVDERGLPDIPHSTRLVVVDGQGVVRGLHDGTLAASVDAVRAQIRQLQAEQP